MLLRQKCSCIGCLVSACLLLVGKSQGVYQQFNPGFDLFAYPTDNRWPWKYGGESNFVRSFNAGVVDIYRGRTTLLWTHAPQSPAPSGEEDLSFNHTAKTLYDWFRSGDPIVTLLPNSFIQGSSRFADANKFDAESKPLDCAQHSCSDNQTCAPYFYCLYRMMLARNKLGYLFESVFRDYLYSKWNITPQYLDESSWSCLISLSSAAGDQFNLFDTFNPCESARFDLTRENWQLFDVDAVLHTTITGGVDQRGFYWEGRRANEPVAQTVGRQFWNHRGVECTVKSPCHMDLDCTKIGSFTALRLGYFDQSVKRPAIFLASAAFVNLEQQLTNQYIELKDAIESLALDTFGIDIFSPAKSVDFGIQNSLTGPGTIFTVLGGFIPGGAGLALNSAGSIAGGVGDFLANSIPPDPNAAQKRFAEQVKTYYNALVGGMEDLVTQLFEGKSIPRRGLKSESSNFTIFDLIRDGAWVNASAITRVSKLNKKIRTEVLARSIDSLWKTPTSNKMWVLFVDLGDDKISNSTQKCVAGKSRCQTSIHGVLPSMRLAFQDRCNWRLAAFSVMNCLKNITCYSAR